MINNILFKFSSFNSLYGQASTVSFKLLNRSNKVTLQTHWEDNCEYYSQPEQAFYLKIKKIKVKFQTLKNEIIKQKQIFLNIIIIMKQLMEIYSIYQLWQFFILKDKSEICRVKAKNLEINSALEENYRLKIMFLLKNYLFQKQQIYIKKMENVKFMQVMYKLYKKIYPIMQKFQFLENIAQNNHFYIQSSANSFNTGKFSGRLKCNIKTESFFIKSLSGLFDINYSKNVQLGIKNQQNQGFIEADNIILNIYDKLKFNIFNYGKSIYQFNESYYKIYIECDKLEFRLINNPFGML
ncbi:unnamed protein product [Paramecium primaurelia]|uniref:Uncharacterized protein n=1 Tax=Paramecium primaurelia TaxID=5886 RepID=A0A8S1JNG3_PARPR|nr:unnamed protein product [Paramecium primaurelia]